MNIEDYKKYCDEILEIAKANDLINYFRAEHMFHNLLEVYAQDGALAGEDYYANKMVAKGQLLCDVALRLKGETKPIGKI